MSRESAASELLSSEAEYHSSLGSAFQGDSRELLEELPDNSVDLVVTSPPFALQHEKEYGNEGQDGYNDWFL
jgi:site-specific DNA-methyltransferase (cytosine-N4-specific)